MACTPESAAAIVGALRISLSPARRSHSLGTASCAALYCLRHGLDAEKGHLAGLAHDLARELPGPELLRLAGREGPPLRDWERAAPVLVHGRAAAGLLRGSFGVSDPEVLAAVCDHVTGRPGMPELSKAVFCADFLEPGREFVEDELREQALELPLDEATALVLERVFAFLRRRGLWIATPALDLYEELGGNVATQT